ncbi:MAG: SDR family oxidoreductase [Bacteroidota bacterium]
MAEKVLILGATSDIARAIAHQHAQAGSTLLLAGRNTAELEKDAQDIRLRYQAKVEVAAFDAQAYASHAAFWQALSPQPDWVYLVFGYMGEQERVQQDWTEAEQTLAVNFVGAVSILERVAQSFEERGSGTIVGVSSVAGERGRASNYLYGSAKAGLTAYLSGLRNRLAKQGVHVLTVKPGFVRTAMTAGMDLPPVITAEPEKVAKDIIKAARRKKNVIYTLWMWRYIMLIIRNIPEGIFKKLSL